MMSSNNGGIKKMSLEEFLGDDSLGDSVWNEDDINLDAITNTTNIDILKSKTSKHGGGNGDHHTNPFGYRSPPSHHGNFVDGGGISGTHNSSNINAKPYTIPAGPPYIVKFSQLPPNFAAVDIDDLFHEKFTKFKKCKMFWELNPNPSIATLNTGTVFEQNFKREGKVAFVELITGRDMDKILKYWTQPLLKYYNIKVEPAMFEDFNEYNAKVKLLTYPRDDASKPYIPPKPKQPSKSPKSSKSNPFGSAKPVDTQSKILEIEEKVGKLHVEDTSTLRRISDSEPNNPQQHQQRVTILKKSHGEESSSSSSAVEDPPTKPLSYLQVIKKTAEESKKSPSSSSFTTRLSSPITNPATMASATTALPATTTTSANADSSAQLSSSSSSSSLEKGSVGPSVVEDGLGGSGEHRQRSKENNNSDNNIASNNNTNQTNSHHRQNHHDTEDRPYYKRTPYSDGTSSFRGRGRGRGGTFRRGNGPRGGARGGGFGYQNDNRRGGPSNHNNSFNGPSNHYHNNQQDNKNPLQEEKHYSIFKPASGFLWESNNEKSMNNHGQRGGHFGRGSYRGGRGRRNNGFTTV